MTAIVGDQVVLLDRYGAPTMLVVVLTAGCVSAVWEEGRGLVRQVTDQVLAGA